MSDTPNRPNKVIVRPYGEGHWMILGVNNLTGQEEKYLTGLDLTEAEKAAQALADRYGIPIVKEEN